MQIRPQNLATGIISHAKQTGKHINKKHPQVGAKFVIEINKFKFIIDINAADVVELLWARDVPHYTDHHLFSEEEKKRTTYLQGAVTREKNKTRKGNGKVVSELRKRTRERVMAEKGIELDQAEVAKKVVKGYTRHSADRYKRYLSSS